MKRSLLITAFAACLGLKSHGASFAGLGFLPGASGYRFSHAYGVSSNGSIVVGDANAVGSTSWRAVRWNQANVILDLAGEDWWGAVGRATAASADGSTIVGENNLLGFHWTQAAGLLAITDLDTAAGVSADGTVIVGSVLLSGRYLAVRWTQAGGAVPLGSLQGGTTSSYAAGVSADGSLVAGRSGDSGYSGTQGFRWTQAGGMVGLGCLLGANESEAYGISGDGSVIVGTSGGVAFRWTEAGGMVSLGTLPDEPFSAAWATSGDGSVVVGSGDSAFIWDRVRGLRKLRDLLVNGYGLNLAGWTLTYATAVSADGTTVVGTGTHNGYEEAYVARLDPLTVPTPWLILSVTVTNQNVRLEWTTAGGHRYVVQKAPAAGAGGLTTNFIHISPVIAVGGTGSGTTNYLHAAGATNRGGYYRVRLGP